MVPFTSGNWSTRVICPSERVWCRSSKGTWNCSDLKRVVDMVDCWSIVLILAPLLREGYAHPFSVEKPAPQKDLDDLNYAIENKRNVGERSPSL